MDLRFILYCDNDPIDLGIEDAQGNWDITAFKRHIQSCGPCGRFLEVVGLDIICDLELHQRIAKGNPKVAPCHEQAEIRTRSNHSPLIKKK